MPAWLNSILVCFYVFWLFCVLIFLYIIWRQGAKRAQLMDKTRVEAALKSAEAAMKTAEAAHTAAQAAHVTADAVYLLAEQHKGDLLIP